ncbi:MAG: hypothetical protein AB7D36_01760 [Oscillospiraceae bacterium]
MGKKRFFSKLTPAVLIVLILALALVGGTIAWLAAGTDPITNSFTVGTVDVSINENFDGDVKSDVAVTNPNDPQNVPVYVRVALVPTWVNDSGNPVGVSASLADLSIDWGSTDWMTGSDGYYYYKYPLSVGETSTNLIDTATVTTDNGYRMQLQVVADAVQSNPASAVQSVWPVAAASNGTLSMGGGD